MEFAADAVAVVAAASAVVVSTAVVVAAVVVWGQGASRVVAVPRFVVQRFASGWGHRQSFHGTPIDIPRSPRAAGVPLLPSLDYVTALAAG